MTISLRFFHKYSLLSLQWKQKNAMWGIQGQFDLGAVNINTVWETYFYFQPYHSTSFSNMQSTSIALPQLCCPALIFSLGPWNIGPMKVQRETCQYILQASFMAIIYIKHNSNWKHYNLSQLSTRSSNSFSKRSNYPAHQILRNESMADDDF